MRYCTSTLFAAIVAISTLCAAPSAFAQQSTPCDGVVVYDESSPGCVVFQQTSQLNMTLEAMDELDEHGSAIVSMERELIDQRTELEELSGRDDGSERSRRNARRIAEIDTQLAELAILSGRVGNFESMLGDTNIAVSSIMTLLEEQVVPDLVNVRIKVNELQAEIETERLRNDEQDGLLADHGTRITALEESDAAQDAVIEEIQDRKPIRFAFGGGVFAGSGVNTAVLGQAGFDVELGSNVRVLTLFNVGTNMDNLVLGGQLGVSYSIDRVSLGAFVMVNRDLGSNAPGAHTMSVLVGPSFEYAIGGDEGHFALFTEGGYMTSDVDGESREGGGVLAGPRFRF